MTLWNWIGIALGVLWAADAVRLRRRAQALPSIEPKAEPLNPAFVLWCAPGVHVPVGVQAGAEAFAEANGLAAVDLVPEHWRTFELLGFLQVVDPETFREALLAPGFSAGQAVLVRQAEAARAGLATPITRLELRSALQRLKRYCPASTAFAIANLEPSASTTRERWAAYRELFFSVAPTVLVGQLSLLVLAGLAAWRGTGVTAWFGLLALHMQGLFVFRDGPLSPTDILPATLLAWPWQMLEALGLVAYAATEATPETASAADRQAYRAELEKGTERLFNARTPACPLCGAARLWIVDSFPDRFQHKPGRFTLDRCGACGLLFQNPQLNAEGLSFYYRDFYDGLGAPWLDSLFASSVPSYLSRAREVDVAPRRWLDVGGGYGHQCLVARSVWPDTRFECLDIGEAVEEGARRGWFQAAHRGSLPQLAPTLLRAFDVVSLSHCLEHTPDPRKELAAARDVLAPGGTLIVEVPDPESRMGPLLRTWWMPYLQPQHLNLLPLLVLSRLLGDLGFEIVRVRRGQAHTGVDFVGAALLAIDALAPPPAPWLAKTPDPRWRFFVWGLGLPLLVAGWCLDGVHRSLLGFPRFSNAYRVIARRPSEGGANSGPGSASLPVEPH